MYPVRKLLLLSPKSITLLSLLVPLLLSGCGKNNDPKTVNNGVASTCQNGQVLSAAYGCLAPSGFSGSGNYNGTAVAASCWSGTVMTQQGCQPIGSAASYYGQTGQQSVTCPYGGQPYYYQGYGWYCR